MHLHFLQSKLLVLFGCFMVLMSGCASGGFLGASKHDFPKADAENPATRCLDLWEPADGKGLDGRPARGFAGQIFFFTQNPRSRTPVEVDGDVRIYVFDDQGTPEEQAKPIHQFDFIGGAWRKYLVDTQFGPAYNIFIPYVRKGSHQAQCALRVRLTPPDGSVVLSDMADVTLKGLTDDSEETKKITADRNVRPASVAKRHQRDRVQKTSVASFDTQNSVTRDPVTPVTIRRFKLAPATPTENPTSTSVRAPKRLFEQPPANLHPLSGRHSLANHKLASPNGRNSQSLGRHPLDEPAARPFNSNELPDAGDSDSQPHPLGRPARDSFRMSR